MRAAAAYQRWAESTNASPHFNHSTTADAADAHFAERMDFRIPIRLHLKAGQVLIIDGRLLHAGDAGEVGPDGHIIPAPRVHFYVTPRNGPREPVEEDGTSSTWLLSGLLAPGFVSHALKKRFFDFSRGYHPFRM